MQENKNIDSLINKEVRLNFKNILSSKDISSVVKDFAIKHKNTNFIIIENKGENFMGESVCFYKLQTEDGQKIDWKFEKKNLLFI